MVGLSCFKGGSVKTIDSKNKFDAIKELIHKTPILVSNVKNIKKLEDSVIEREKLISTGLGNGIAIAHGKCMEVNRIIIVLGISYKGINYNEIGEVVKND